MGYVWNKVVYMESCSNTFKGQSIYTCSKRPHSKAEQQACHHREWGDALNATNGKNGAHIWKVFHQRHSWSCTRLYTRNLKDVVCEEWKKTPLTLVISSVSYPNKIQMWFNALLLTFSHILYVHLWQPDNKSDCNLFWFYRTTCKSRLFKLEIQRTFSPIFHSCSFSKTWMTC